MSRAILGSLEPAQGTLSDKSQFSTCCKLGHQWSPTPALGRLQVFRVWEWEVWVTPLNNDFWECRKDCWDAG